MVILSLRKFWFHRSFLKFSPVAALWDGDVDVVWYRSEPPVYIGIGIGECITDGLVQDCSNSIANALELLQSYTKPSICVDDLDTGWVAFQQLSE